MCGINGFTASKREILQRMVACTEHRGPDARGVYHDEYVSLGHNRLSIIDLDERSNQPFVSPDGRFVLVFNGEIYNYQELRETLPLYSFSTKSDTEVLLALMITQGEEALSKLRGMFAFALWDAKEKTLLLVRDQMGIKPLFYALCDNVLYFSSELTPLIHATGLRTLNAGGCASYIHLNYTAAPTTLIEGIEKVRPGHLIRYAYGARHLEQTRYWHPAFDTRRAPIEQEIYEVFDGAISRQLIAERPVGIMLSGGIDSSIVLHHAMRHAKDPRTFSTAFELPDGLGDKYSADAQLAARTAQQYGAAHTTFTCSLQDIRDGLDEALSAQSDPIANPTGVTRYLFYRKVRQEGIVVALGGDGGDELFGGYDRHKRLLAAHYFQKLPKSLVRSMANLHPKAGDLSLEVGAPLYLRLMSQLFADTPVIKEQKYASKEKVLEMLAAHASEVSSKTHPLHRFMQLDRESWLAEESLNQADLCSMSHALELRVPLLDLDVVHLADSLAPLEKFTPFTLKKILRHVYREHLPSFILSQPKRGWLSPGAKWLRDPVIEAYARSVFSSGYYSGLDTLFDWDAVQSMYTAHLHQKGYHLHPLWDILQLQVWARKNSITV